MPSGDVLSIGAKRSALWSSYEKWCAGRPGATRQLWGRWMRKHYRMESIESVRTYFGIALHIHSTRGTSRGAHVP
jgi:hypothetical protein